MANDLEDDPMATELLKVLAEADVDMDEGEPTPVAVELGPEAERELLCERLRQLEERLAEVTAENRVLRELAHKDALTGLSNRRSFTVQLDYAMKFAVRYGGTVSVLLSDLDGMKRLNDTCGHPAGDVELQRVGEVFRGAIRSSDLAARLGGDEFAVIMPATDAESAARVAERIRSRVEQLEVPEGIKVSASFGVATFDPRVGRLSADKLLSRADQALYVAKREGRNRVVIDRRSQLKLA